MTTYGSFCLLKFNVPFVLLSLFSAPEQTPMNATARATGPYTINVTWSAISAVDARSLHGYRVLYFPVSSPRQLRDIATGRNDIEATITGLRPFTLYGVQIAAFSTEDGNFTTPVYAQTWQAGKRRVIIVKKSNRQSQGLMPNMFDASYMKRNYIWLKFFQLISE